MSTTAQFEKLGVPQAELASSLDEDGPFVFHGVALGADDVTHGSSGTLKKWPASELKKAASTLAGTPLVKDHENTVDGAIGTVTDAKYEPGTGVLYQAEIAEQYVEYARKIKDGLLDVSVRAFHAPTEQLEEDEETGAKIVEEIEFDNLSVVLDGASPSNTAEFGPATQMSAEALEAAFEEATSDGTDTSDSTDSKSQDDEDEGVDPKSDVMPSIVNVTWEETAEQGKRWMAELDGAVEDTDEFASLLAEYHDVEEDEILFTRTTGTQAEYMLEDELESGEAPDSETEELESYSFHTVSYDGTTEGEWSRPDMKDFNTDDLGEIADHFMLSKSGFESPDAYTDLTLPIVEPGGNLSLGGLRAAIGGHGAPAVKGLSSEKEERVTNYVLKLAKEEFGEDWDGTSAAAGDPDETDSEELDVSFYEQIPVVENLDEPSDAELRMVTGDDGRTASADLTMDTDELEDKIASMDDPVVVEGDELEDLREEAEQASKMDERLEEMSSSMSSLSETRDLVDEAGREAVEALAEADDPKVVTAEEFERHEELVGEVRDLYADELAEHYPMDAETLGEKFTVGELKEMLEETDEASLSASEDSPDVKGEQANQEELDEAEESEEREASLEDAREDLAKELEDLGWYDQAEAAREGAYDEDVLAAE